MSIHHHGGRRALSKPLTVELHAPITHKHAPHTSPFYRHFPRQRVNSIIRRTSTAIFATTVFAPFLFLRVLQIHLYIYKELMCMHWNAFRFDIAPESILLEVATLISAAFLEPITMRCKKKRRNKNSPSSTRKLQSRLFITNST